MIYQKTAKQYIEVIKKNIDEHQYVKQLFTNKNMEIIEKFTIEKIKKNTIITKIALNYPLHQLNETLKSAKKHGDVNYKKIISKLKNNIVSSKDNKDIDTNVFFDLLTELQAANLLVSGKINDLDGKIISVEFTKNNAPRFDLKYFIGEKQKGKKYLVSVKRLRNYDPFMEIFHNHLITESLTEEKLRGTMWSVKSDFMYKMGDFKENNGKNFTRFRKIIKCIADEYSGAKNIRYKQNNVNIYCEIKKKKDIDSLPSIIYGDSAWKANKADYFYRFGKVYCRILDHSYKAFLDFKNEVNDDKIISKCRIMIFPDWPGNKILYEEEIKETIDKIIKIFDLDKIMKLDVII